MLLNQLLLELDTKEKPPVNVDEIFSFPVMQLPVERLLLFSLILGRRPDRVLEIGTAHGGSAAIICKALDHIGKGELVCVDPRPTVKRRIWNDIQHRTRLLEKRSPDALNEAARGEKFDFVLIDGDHSFDGVEADFRGLLPYLSDGAVLLFHDAHFTSVRTAIDKVIQEHQTRLQDCGLLNRTASVDQNGITWGGLRMVIYRD